MIMPLLYFPTDLESYFLRVCILEMFSYSFFIIKTDQEYEMFG